VYFDVEDGRMIFAIPRGKTTYVGTTDTNYYGTLNRVVATKADAEYLLKATNHTFQGFNLTLEDIESNWIGLRPLIHELGKDPSELSRKDELFLSKSGLISIAGGKLTGYRKMADRVLAAVSKQLTASQKSKLKRSSTKKIPLVTPAIKTSKEVVAYQDELKNQLAEMEITDPYMSWYLCTTYGKNADLILDKKPTFKEGSTQEQLIRAELWYCIQHEMTNSLADFFVRRTSRLYFDIDSVTQFMEIILRDCIHYLDWDEKRIALEQKIMAELIQDATVYYDKEFE
jgi:glycerol-3-phosphate dehydrogenase